MHDVRMFITHKNGWEFNLSGLSDRHVQRVKSLELGKHTARSTRSTENYKHPTAQTKKTLRNKEIELSMSSSVSFENFFFACCQFFVFFFSCVEPQKSRQIFKLPFFLCRLFECEYFKWAQKFHLEHCLNFSFVSPIFLNIICVFFPLNCYYKCVHEIRSARENNVAHLFFLKKRLLYVSIRCQRLNEAEMKITSTAKCESQFYLWIQFMNVLIAYETCKMYTLEKKKCNFLAIVWVTLLTNVNRFSNQWKGQHGLAHAIQINIVLNID